jgi:hypothetical protein
LGELLDPGPGLGVEGGEAAADEDAVLVAEGHEVRYRAEGDELEPGEVVLAEPLGLAEGEGDEEVLEDVDLLERLGAVASDPR